MSGVGLDAWALVAYLKGEPAAGRVEDAIATGEALASEINLGEVLYSVARSHSADRAIELVEGLRRLLDAQRPDWELIVAAARLKARHPLSHADAFAVATARRHDGVLYSGDPEILALGSLVEAIDLRGR